MKKDDWYKILVIGIVAIFVFEGIAIGLMQSNSNGGSAAAVESAASLTGQASANVTIVRYEPYVIVKGGNSSAVEAAKERLISAGVATYAVPNAEGLIVNLRSGKDVAGASEEFEKANATVLASATITTSPKVRVQGTDMATTVEGTSFSLQIRPSYEEGSVAEATFVAQVENGAMVGIGSFMLLPSQVSGVHAVAALVGAQQSESAIEVPWQNRSAARQIARESGAAYREKSYILIPSNATKQQLADAYANGSGYVTGVQVGILSVRNDFADSEKAGADLSRLGLSATFPPSTATFENQSSNASAEALLGKLRGAGIDATLVSRTTAKAALPDFVEKGGRKFKTGGMVVSFEQVAPINGSSVELLLGFQADGSAISQLVSVTQAVQNGTPG